MKILEYVLQQWIFERWTRDYYVILILPVRIAGSIYDRIDSRLRGMQRNHPYDESLMIVTRPDSGPFSCYLSGPDIK